MKVKEKKVGFKPFSIELTFESLEEAKDLYVRLGLTKEEVNSFSDNQFKTEIHGYEHSKIERILSKHILDY